MSKTRKDSPSAKQERADHRHRRRATSARAVRRDQPDQRKLGRAVIALVIAQDEAAAKAADQHSSADATESGKAADD